MNCSAVEPRLSAYLDGELCGTDSLAVRDHLAVCPRCAEELEALRMTKLLLTSVRTPQPVSSPETLLRQIRLADREVSRKWAIGLMAASAVCAGLFAFAVFRKPPAGPAQPSQGVSVAAADAPYLYSGDTLGGGLPIVPAAYSGD